MPSRHAPYAAPGRAAHAVSNSRDVRPVVVFDNVSSVSNSYYPCLLLGLPGVDGLRVVRQERLDEALRDELLHGLARQGAVHLELLRDD